MFLWCRMLAETQPNPPFVAPRLFSVAQFAPPEAAFRLRLVQPDANKEGWNVGRGAAAPGAQIICTFDHFKTFVYRGK